MRWISFLGAAVFLLGSAGCVDTDPTIFVDITFKDPSVDVDLETNKLGAKVTGGFTLALHLGARAAGSTEVSVQQFELVSEDENTIIVPPSLPLSAVGQELPIIVEPGTDEDVKIEIDYGSALAEKEDGQKLCTFSKVHFRGSIGDSLRGTTQPVRTEDPVTVTGCPAP